MMPRNMRKTILREIPSKELRREIELRAFPFSEPELLKIAYRCAPSYGKLQLLLELVDREAKPETAAYARQLRQWQTEVKNEFCREIPDTVYELQIRTKPDAQPEIAVFDDLVAVRGRLRERFERRSKTAEPVDITVTRLHIDANGGSDRIGRAKLSSAGLFERIRVVGMPAPVAGELAVDGGVPVFFPPHIPFRAAVRYRGEDGFWRLGIHLGDTEGVKEALPVLPFDGVGKDGRLVWVYPPFVSLAELNELDAMQKADYFAVLEQLNRT